MRSFPIPVVVTMGLAVAVPASAQAQILGGAPALTAPFSIPFAPLPSALGGSSAIPYATGAPVEFALNRALWSMASRGYGPYAGYSPLLVPRNTAGAYPAYYGPWNAGRPLTVPANPGTWVQPWNGNPGLHKGWYKGGGGGKKGKGR
jgi:hypothetical protein